MSAFRQNRAWFWIAIAAISIAILALLVPHGLHAAGQPDWFAMLPVYFVGLLLPLILLPLTPALSRDHSPKAPTLAASFQRPPPFCA